MRGREGERQGERASQRWGRSAAGTGARRGGGHERIHRTAASLLNGHRCTEQPNLSAQLQTCSAESPWVRRGAEGPARSPRFPGVQPSERERDDPRIRKWRSTPSSQDIMVSPLVKRQPSPSRADHGFDTDAASLRCCCCECEPSPSAPPPPAPLAMADCVVSTDMLGEAGTASAPLPAPPFMPFMP